MREILAAWQFTPQITLGLLLMAYLYLRGARGRSRAARRGGRWNWQPGCFLTGLLCLYVALESPLDFLADHLFFVHQIQHLILMMVVPILLLAPAPEGILTAGLPSWARRLVLAPIARNRAYRTVIGFFMHPCTATILGGGQLYFWMIPTVYDTALSNERIHDLMHFSLLFGGLLFWSRVLDRRRPPVGRSYLARAAMLKVNLMMVAALGGYLTSKQLPVYSDSGFGLLRIMSIVDEQIGGAILWVGGSAILLAAMAMTIRRWIRVEAERSEIPPVPAETLDPEFGPSLETASGGVAPATLPGSALVDGAS